MSRPAPQPPVGRYAHDDALLAALGERGRAGLRVYRVDRPLVVLGRGSRPERELHLERCAADAVPLLRRRGGGCAVVLDPGNVIVSAALPAAGIGGNLARFAALSGWLIATLERLGLTGVRQDGISDLVRGDRKVGGACIYRSKGLLLYAATLLAAPRVELMERYLAHPPREPDYRRGRPHAAFVDRLLPAGGVHGAAELEAALRRELQLADLGWEA